LYVCALSFDGKPKTTYNIFGEYINTIMSNVDMVTKNPISYIQIYKRSSILDTWA